MKVGRKKGTPKTGGRVPGIANRKTREIAEAAMQKGVTPLEVMLEAMRDAAAEYTHLKEAYAVSNLPADLVRLKEARKDAAEHAKDAAPYLHPRLQPVDGRGSTDMNIKINIVRLGDTK